MIGQIGIAAVASLLLGACSTVQAPAAPPPAQSPDGTAPMGKCDNSNIQQFVGQQRSKALEAEMLRVSGASTVRWAPFGTAITMEFSADRLTAFLDENDRINRISCS